MRSFEELERLWHEDPAASRTGGRVRLICVRKPEGMKECPERVAVSTERGVEGDRWADKPGRDPEAQVTIMTTRVAELIAGDHTPLAAAGDNFLVDLDLAEAQLPAGTRLRLGGALLEVSATPHTGCKKFRERFGMDALRWVNDHQERRLRGMNCRVLESGEVALGDRLEIVG